MDNQRIKYRIKKPPANQTTSPSSSKPNALRELFFNIKATPAHIALPMVMAIPKRPMAAIRDVVITAPPGPDYISC